MASSGSYDVVVVGAGLSGAVIASTLARQGLQVVVLEATNRVGGSFKRWPGLAILGTPEPFVDLAARLGESSAIRLWDLTQDNLDQLAADLRLMDEVVDPVGSLRLAGNIAETRRLRESVPILREQGYEVSLEDDDKYGDLAALSTSADIRFVPRALAEFLLNHENIDLELEAEVQSIHPRSEGGIAVWAHKTYLWAEKVVFANGIYLSRFLEKAEEILDPVCVHTLEVQNTGELQQPLIIDAGRICFLPDGERAYLAGWGTQEQEVFRRLTGIAEQLCPSAVVYDRGTGWVGSTRGGLPVIDQFPDRENVYFASGFGPYGLNLTYAAADDVVGLIERRQPSAMFSLNRLM
jgi:glycine/D-amino acid oxidase-like deaminating enzyme